MPFHLKYKLKCYKNKGDIAGPVSILFGVAKAVESCSGRGYIDKLYDKMNLVSSEENVNKLARAIHEFVS
jgi:hypothetical protein